MSHRVAVQVTVQKTIFDTQWTGEGEDRHQVTVERIVQEVVTEWIEIQIPEPVDPAQQQRLSELAQENLDAETGSFDEEGFLSAVAEDPSLAGLPITQGAVDALGLALEAAVRTPYRGPSDGFDLVSNDVPSVARMSPESVLLQSSEDPWAVAAEIIAEFPTIRINMGDTGVTDFTGLTAQPWTAEELRALQTGLRYTRDAVGGDAAFAALFPEVTFVRMDHGPFSGLGSVHPWWSDRVHLGSIDILNNDQSDYVWTVIHELGHVLHNRTGGIDDFMDATGGECGATLDTFAVDMWIPGFETAGKCFPDYQPGGGTTGYGGTQPGEDFADTFVTWVYLEVGSPADFNQRRTGIDNTRLDFMEGWVDENND